MFIPNDYTDWMPHGQWSLCKTLVASVINVTREDHVLHRARTRSRNALLMCGRGVTRQGKGNGWLGKGSESRSRSRSVNATHRVTPFKYSASNVISLPSTSVAGLKSSVASIVTTALQMVALAVCRPDDDEYTYERRVNAWQIVAYLDILSSQSQKQSWVYRQLTSLPRLRTSQG
jgi:hypothetical protein